MNNSMGFTAMQTSISKKQKTIRTSLLYATLGLSALSLLISWSVEKLAEALFLTF
jgi:hypothetical protein